MQLLTSLNISPWAKNAFGDTLYSYALSQNYWEVAAWCLENDKPEFSHIVSESVNNRELINTFFDKGAISQELFKLMLDHGLSLSTIVNQAKENVLHTVARLGEVQVLLHLFRLFTSSSFVPNDDYKDKLRENIKNAINMEDNHGNKRF